MKTAKNIIAILAITTGVWFNANANTVNINGTLSTSHTNCKVYVIDNYTQDIWFKTPVTNVSISVSSFTFTTPEVWVEYLAVENGQTVLKSEVRTSVTLASGEVIRRLTVKTQVASVTVTITCSETVASIANDTIVLLQTVTGAENIQKANSVGITVYPNPVVSSVNVSGVSAEKIQVFGITGTELKAVNNQDWIDMSDLSTGYYIVLVTANSGSVKGYQKVYKQ